MPCIDHRHHSGVFLYALDLIELNDEDLGRSSARWEIHTRDVTYNRSSAATIVQRVTTTGAPQLL